MSEALRSPTTTTVTIFGAGIAGLTAAQELVLRGFRVNVVAPEINKELRTLTYDRGIGGMARSQYVYALPPTREERRFPRWVSSETFLADETIVLETREGQTLPVDPARAAKTVARVVRAIEWLVEDKRLPYELRITIPVNPDGDSGAPSYEARRAWMKNQLETPLASHKLDLDRFFPPPMVLDGAGPEANTWVVFHTRFQLAPAEHGFRFFPSFYRHLFDTMKRTQILQPKDAELGRRTVFDNLIPSDQLGLARVAPARAFTIPRAPLTSFEDVRTYLRLVLDELGYTVDDIARYSLAIFKYMTSSSLRRREQYEGMSWGDFVQMSRFSPTCRQHIEFGPQMTAALRGSESDARTQGNITVQLILDQLREGVSVDSTLDGPTSGAWLDHWHRFLVHEGVSFVRGEVADFIANGSRVTPVLSTLTPAAAKDDILASDYFVFALSLPEMHRLAKKFLKAAPGGVEVADLQHVIDFVEHDLPDGDLDRDLAKAKPSGPLQHLSGIQFYFDTDLRFWRGHTQYLDSAWGLTSIAQPQFWVRSRDQGDAYRTVVSVDIGIWDRPYRGTTAWQCPLDQLAVYTWEQIRDHHLRALQHKYGEQARLPEPIAFALDHDIISEAKERRAEMADTTPFLVNRTARFHRRPGRVSSSDRASFPHYHLMAGQYVMCGTYLQTYTRLTSMEGANESARHAVNTIIASSKSFTEPCEIWDPEVNELPDLTWLRELDDALVRRRLPHFVDILGWRELPFGTSSHHLRDLVKELAR